MDFEYRKSIVSYYDNTRLDYKVLWFRKNTRAVHFGFYDEGVKSHGDALLNLNKVMARKANIGNGDVILDAGCGMGAGSIWLAKNYKVNVKGITLVPHQVKMATKDALSQKLTNSVSFSEQDYCNTNFEDESFSLIWACESMCHAEKKADFYKEAYRLLKPGGRIISADYLRTKRNFNLQDEKLLHDWLDGWSIKDIDTFEEHKKNAAACNFTDFEIENITEFTEPSLKHLYSMANKLWGFGKLLKKIGIRNEVNHGNHFGSIKQYQALKENLWYYGLISMKKN